MVLASVIVKAVALVTESLGLASFPLSHILYIRYSLSYAFEQTLLSKHTVPNKKCPLFSCFKKND